ncbi:bifunctional 4-hydroxy-2-oxoglutarate aldolase/2-dehydro-3-deoxy-phosphogluconate aldolase [Arthrobacter sp. ATA002]|uniref:bifunctional 4-hydroxy-2-oxoglutarate aldolase/2-dehydro-3-deoxy-phosphogluconate aldolase n=1 Tax=Arthrobacter sp. ATA002 TaxID=2991715 RepID=UPI0022A695A4|nr:bifunctional 4-hydroxy-2-oxoglutarate aldolase/2-dehydro-3-deoxy-phosphogluconate aldolase [Arthrobacter sp. ATA002]WAP51850.1 bifunctional 4-hydroxy-2-oxoglutarate aldolase/2-dehydro-3-deoxy-phosphogluconate aldolase [Arthrobacter sp. ATA002]
MSAALLDTRLIAILRAADASRAEAVAETLIENGVRSLELTLTTVGALDVLARLAARLGTDIDLGMGTVLTVDDVNRAADAGACFVVSPTVDTDVVSAAQARGLASYPGALTPTEIATAWSAGATAVKLFPGGALGPSYLSAVRAPLPNIPIIPTGGVALQDIPLWLKAGARAVGLGSPLIGDAMSPDGDLTALAHRTRQASDAAFEGRE